MLLRLLLVLGLVTVVSPVEAQWWGGCRDNYGRPVPDYPNYSLPDIARAGLAQTGDPVIEYNPNVVLSVSPSTRRFFYMHECGHHALGQISSGVLIPYASEQQADCWAAVELVRSGTFTQNDLRAVQTDVSRSPGDWTHLPGPQRALNLIGCLQQAGLVGGGGGGSSGGPVCRVVTDWQDVTTWEVQVVSESVPCTHCGCTNWGCGCMHQYDVVPVRRQVPVTRRVPVQRRVCN